MAEEEKKLKIAEISSDTVEDIKETSAFGLPDRPSAEGYKPADIKAAFWEPLLADTTGKISLVTEINRIVDEANKAFEEEAKTDKDHDERIKRAFIDVAYDKTSGKISFTTDEKHEESEDNPRASVLELPLNKVVVKREFDAENNKITLTLEDGSVVDIDPDNLLMGLRVKNDMGTEDAPKSSLSLASDANTHTVTLSVSEDYKSEVNNKIETVADDASKALDDAKTSLETAIGGKFANVEYNSTTGVLTFTLGNGSKKTVDLPLELLVSGGYYDAANNKLVLELANGNKIEIPAGDLLGEFNADGATLKRYEKEGKYYFALSDAYKGKVDTEILADGTYLKVTEVTSDGDDPHTTKTFSLADAYKKKLDTEIAVAEGEFVFERVKDAQGQDTNEVMLSLDEDLKQMIESGGSAGESIANAISIHDGSENAHSGIRNKIGVDIAEHNVSPSAHQDIRDYVDAKVLGSEGYVVDNTTAQSKDSPEGAIGYAALTRIYGGYKKELVFEDKRATLPLIFDTETPDLTTTTVVPQAYPSGKSMPEKWAKIQYRYYLSVSFVKGSDWRRIELVNSADYGESINNMGGLLRIAPDRHFCDVSDPLSFEIYLRDVTFYTVFRIRAIRNTDLRYHLVLFSTENSFDGKVRVSILGDSANKITLDDEGCLRFTLESDLSKITVYTQDGEREFYIPDPPTTLYANKAAWKAAMTDEFIQWWMGGTEGEGLSFKGPYIWSGRAFSKKEKDMWLVPSYIRSVDLSGKTTIRQLNFSDAVKAGFYNNYEALADGQELYLDLLNRCFVGSKIADANMASNLDADSYLWLVPSKTQVIASWMYKSTFGDAYTAYGSAAAVKWTIYYQVPSMED